jgi:hypothetical protein
MGLLLCYILRTYLIIYTFIHLFIYLPYFTDYKTLRTIRRTLLFKQFLKKITFFTISIMRRTWILEAIFRKKERLIVRKIRYLFIYIFIYSYTYLFIYVFIYLRIYLLIYLFTYLFMYLFIYVFIYLQNPIAQYIPVYSNTSLMAPRILHFLCTEVSKIFIFQTSIAFAECWSIYI